LKKDSKKIDQCFICGCTEHKFIGCIKHWKNHKKNIGERCQQK
jgi:hypothetical protein